MTTPAEAERVFRAEYDRIDREVYDYRLPPFPGLRVAKSIRLYGSAPRWIPGKGFRGKKFMLNESLLPHLIDDLTMDTIRHEVAHVACAVISHKYGHGPAWKDHARFCGAQPVRCKTMHVVNLRVSAKWTVKCAKGCFERGYGRRPRTGSVCRRCKGEIVVNANIQESIL